MNGFRPHFTFLPGRLYEVVLIACKGKMRVFFWPPLLLLRILPLNPHAPFICFRKGTLFILYSFPPTGFDPLAGLRTTRPETTRSLTSPASSSGIIDSGTVRKGAPGFIGALSILYFGLAS